jgi:hypothetical protein
MTRNTRSFVDAEPECEPSAEPELAPLLRSVKSSALDIAKQALKT